MTQTSIRSVELPVACCAPIAAPTLTESEIDATSVLFKALGDTHRIKIFNMLSNSSEPVCVCDITDSIELSQPTVSFHLKKLVDAGLLKREKRGTWAYYSVNDQALGALRAVVGGKKGAS
jgi:ArsR family transcriptional regulator